MSTHAVAVGCNVKVVIVDRCHCFV